MESVIGGTFVSISHSGVAVFDQPITSGIGGIEIDLVSAPIPPGRHTMRLSTAVGGIEVFLPSYATFTVGGDSVVGGYEVHEGFDFVDRIGRKLTSLVSKPKIPDHAAAPANPDAPVHIHFEVQRGVGGLDIYRLPVAT